jgi:hypothetical protein
VPGARSERSVIQTSIPEFVKGILKADPITPLPPTIRHFADMRSLFSLSPTNW